MKMLKNTDVCVEYVKVDYLSLDGTPTSSMYGVHLYNECMDTTWYVCDSFDRLKKEVNVENIFDFICSEPYLQERFLDDIERNGRLFFRISPSERWKEVSLPENR